MARQRASSVSGRTLCTRRWRYTGLALALAVGVAHAAETPEDVRRRLALAEQQYAMALARQHGWSVTQPLIDAARSALAQGELDRASALAERALLTAEKALEQAKTEESAWRGRVLRE